MGLVIQRDRVRGALVRVDPIGVALRWSSVIPRRTYQVTCPNALWHIDSNLSLVRWGFVVHGGIDGFSSLVTFLRCATNNRTNTVLCSFLSGVCLVVHPEFALIMEWKTIKLLALCCGSGAITAAVT